MGHATIAILENSVGLASDCEVDIPTVLGALTETHVCMSSGAVAQTNRSDIQSPIRTTLQRASLKGPWPQGAGSFRGRQPGSD